MRTFAIDTNVMISALIKDGLTRFLLTNYIANYVFSDYGLEEVYRYKDLIMRKSGMGSREFDVILLRMLKYVRLVPLKMLEEFGEEAYDIIGDVDEKDVVFVAMALTFKCPIWSDDKHFLKQERIKVLNTGEMYSEYENEIS